jgi:hypothetical protein
VASSSPLFAACFFLTAWSTQAVHDDLPRHGTPSAAHFNTPFSPLPWLCLPPAVGRAQSQCCCAFDSHLLTQCICHILSPHCPACLLPLAPACPCSRPCPRWPQSPSCRPRAQQAASPQQQQPQQPAASAALGARQLLGQTGVLLLLLLSTRRSSRPGLSLPHWASCSRAQHLSGGPLWGAGCLCLC